MKRKPVDLGAVRKARAKLRAVVERYPELRGASSETNRRDWERVLTMATKKETNDEQIVIRLPSSLVAWVDAHAEALRASIPGAKFSRADAVRALLLAALEKSGTKKPKEPRG